MKLVIISVPNNVDENDIRRGCAEFAECLELPTIKVNVLDEGDIQVENAASIVSPIVETICAKCVNQDQLITGANFWRLVSTGEINKAMLQTLAAHRNATKAHLNRKKLECFLALFDDALRRM